ncbi:DUF1127 domain-containing protein [Vibrio sp. S4M6]|uniref:DUF1127 domain-containing protein n=1 Tax=Vibrio sinus TaxID=2946865 RepID=UPI002029CCA3|nr:DUF1127 domain-containing protein [Vibrio sinus]MCL9781436.1 DUF1127 domain-containing protein [Vibrio sinus]
MSVSAQQWKGEDTNGYVGFLVAMVKKTTMMALLWLRNYQTRRQLAALPEYLYEDIGLNKEQVKEELNRHFWQ